MRFVRRGVPLARQHKQELLTKFIAVIRATVKGNLLVASIQGALGGLAFWFLGINGFVLGPMIGAMFIAAWHIYFKANPS